MEAHRFILDLLIIVLTARVFAEIAMRLKAPSVIGELFAGVLIGPSIFGWIEPIDAFRFLAEVGIILLLFEVGLGTDIKRLLYTGKKSTLVAIVGFVAPMLLGFSVAYWMFHMLLLESLFIGGTLTATSIGITVRVLTELKISHSHEGQIVIGAAVLDDLLGVMLLSVLYEFSVEGEISLVNSSKVFIFVTIFFILAPVMAKLISIGIKRFDAISELPGLLPTTIISLVLFFAWLAHAMGAPEMLGGFAAGIALSRRFFLPLGLALHTDESFSNLIEHQMRPIISLFTPIFFVVVGLSINFREINWTSPHVWEFSIVLLVSAFAGKLLGALFIRESWATRLMVGMSMIPRGEVGLIFAELGRLSGILNNEVHASLVIVIVLTTIIPPLSIKWFYRKHGHRLKDAQDNHASTDIVS